MNTQKLVLFSFFLLISLNQTFATKWFDLIPIEYRPSKTHDSSPPPTPASVEAPKSPPKSSSPPPPSPPSQQNPFKVPGPDANGQQPTWDVMVDMVSRDIFVTVRDMMKNYEATHKCGPGGSYDSPVGSPGVISPPPAPTTSPSSQTPTSPSPAPYGDDSPSPSPAPYGDDSPSPSPAPYGDDSPSPSPGNDDSPSPSPSPGNDDSPSPSPSPSVYSSPRHSPAAPTPTSPTAPPPGPTPMCHPVKHSCTCTCDGITYRGYSCDINKPCWCNCYSKRTVNDEPLIPIKTEKGEKP